MSGPYDYRSAQPHLSSSSPLHGLQAALSSSPPLSPRSPTPAHRRGASLQRQSRGNAVEQRVAQDDNDEDGDDGTTIGDLTARSGTLRSPSSSNPHPFSGSAKANAESHPSFGRGQLRSKHLRNSPKQAPPSAAAAASGWVLAASSSSNSLGMRKRDVDSVLGQHFQDSSDDCPSSDDPMSMFSTHSSHEDLSRSSQSSVHALHGARLGLGIHDLPGKDGVERQSPLFSEAALTGGTLASSLAPRGSRVRTYSRIQSSSQDPFSGIAGGSPGISAASNLSPRINRATQRRRLVGSSPRQLTRADSGQFVDGNGIRSRNGSGSATPADDTDSGDEGLDRTNLESWEKSVQQSPLRSKRRPSAPVFDWRQKIDDAFERADGAMKWDDLKIKRMDPTIADLAKFVHVPRHRSDGPRTSMSRTSSMAHAGERLSSGPIAGMDNNPPNRIPFGDQRALSATGSNLSSNVELYLARNSLRILPSALFSVTNIVVLSIRSNGIKELPPAIGQLVNLRELNIAQNELNFLPAEIQRLQLDGFVYFPNPFVQPPEDARLSMRPWCGASTNRGKALSTALMPLKNESMAPPPIPARLRERTLPSNQMSSMASGQHQAATDDDARLCSNHHSKIDVVSRYLAPIKGESAKTKMPSLVECCVRRLLQKPLSSDIDDEDEYNLSGAKMLLEGHEADMLSKSRLPLNGTIVRALEAARRSATGAWGRTRPASYSPWFQGLRTVSSTRALRRKRTFELRGNMEDGCDVLPSTPPADQNAFDAFFQNEDGFAEAEASGEQSETEGYGPVDIERDLDMGDDSILNPYFNCCPNPAHYQSDAPSAANGVLLDAAIKDWPAQCALPNAAACIYLEPCVERIEWVSHIAGHRVGGSATTTAANDPKSTENKASGPLARGSGCLPIRWRGCNSRCLDFLEG